MCVGGGGGKGRRAGGNLFHTYLDRAHGRLVPASLESVETQETVSCIWPILTAFSDVLANLAY